MRKAQAGCGHDRQFVIPAPSPQDQKHRDKQHERQNHVHIGDDF